MISFFVHDLLRIFRLVVPVVPLQLCPRQLRLHPRLELRLQCADHLFELRQRHARLERPAQHGVDRFQLADLAPIYTGTGFGFYSSISSSSSYASSSYRAILPQ